MAAKKVQAIRNFLADLQVQRRAVREDCMTMLESLKLEDLATPEDLAAFLEELTATAARRHLIDARGKVAPATARMIRRYVAGMVR